VLLKFVGDVFLFLIGLEPAMAAGFNGVFDAVRLLVRGLELLGGGVVAAVGAIGDFFVGVWNWVKTAGSAIGNFFTDTIPSWWDSVVGFFTSLPGRVVDALSGFREAGRSFIVDTLRDWYEQVFEWVGNIVGIFLSLPQLIPAALDVLQQKLSELWTTIWTNAVQLFWDGVNSLLTVIYAIPGLTEDAGHAVLDFFTSLWNNVVLNVQATVESGFNKVIGFFNSLPDRVRALGPALYNAAVSLGHRIGDGLANIGNFASDIGHRIVNTIKSGINFVISSINNGIAEIDDRLPGSLPRIPLLARGAVVDSPTLALVGEAGPEVVLPLSDRKRAQELAEQSGLLSMLRTGGGGSNVTVIAYLDPSGVIIPTVKTIVNDTFDQQGDELPYARAA
jgi:phage-related protein